MATKIDWCDEVYNPVWGCKNNCPYCYARKINDRFKKIENWNNPEWIESNFLKEFPKKPKRIFVNSMSDISFWKPEWMVKVLGKIYDNPQHMFMFLTKDPSVYSRYEFSYFTPNVWLGVTISKENFLENIPLSFMFESDSPVFFSLEPLSGKIDFEYYPKPDWLIVGAESGNRKNKIIPQPEWIESLIDIEIPLFMKDNLNPYWSGKFRQELPGFELT